MAPLSLLFLIVSSAGAFSPAARPPTQTCTVGGIGVATRGYTSQRPTCGRVKPSFHNINIIGSNENNHVRTSSSLAMNAAAAITTEQRQFNYKKRIAVLMAFMTGWADLLFIKRFNFFGTMMTGNSMKMGMALVEGRLTDASFFLSIIASYIFGVGVFRRAELDYKNKALNGLFAPIVAGCFLWSDYLSWVGTSKFIPAALLSFAWGIINSVGSEVTGTLVFVLTGAMTRFSNMMVDRISRTAGRKKIPKEGMLMSAGVVGGFILGSAWCAFLSLKAPKLVSRGMFSIMGGIYGLLFLWLDREQFGAWWTKKDGKLCELDAEEVNCK